MAVPQSCIYSSLEELQCISVYDRLLPTDLPVLRNFCACHELGPRSIAIGMTGVEIESDWIEGTPGLSMTPDGLVSGVIHELETEAFERDQKGLTEMPAGRATSLCQGKAQEHLAMPCWLR